MDEHSDTPNTTLPRGVPRPPSKAAIDEISRDQGLITDEWAPAPAPGDEGRRGSV